jgi:hypothetical protein
MLLPNQRKAIEDAVSPGEALNVEMSSALLAAFQEADTGHTNTRSQLSIANHEKTNLRWERDESVRLKREMEKEIDLRVESRTSDLSQQLSNAKLEAGKQEYRADYMGQCLKEAQDEFARRERNYRFAICNLKDLVESNLKPSFLSRLTWKIKARRALAEAAGLLPGEDD